MASQNKSELVRLGPFVGLDSTTADTYAEVDRASSIANVDIRRAPGAFVTARGRVNLTTFNADGEIMTLAELNAQQGARYVIASLSSGEVYQYLPDGSFPNGAILPNGQPFTQAVQYGPSLFTNAGQQIALDTASVVRAMKWQYAVSDTGFVPTVAANPHNAINMAQQTYTYLFTIAVQLPTRSYAADEYGQESTPVGFSLGENGTPIYKYAATVPDANTDVLLSANNGNTWGGRLPDGSIWGVNVYRMSTNAPIFYLAASYFWKAGDSWSRLVNGSTFEDSVADASIAPNKQILFNQDAPPISVQSPGAIFAHKERLWVFTVVQDADTFNQPQCQLWYSGYGLPWQFDAASQVLLVGNDGTPDTTGTPTYGDLPLAGVSLASVGVLFKSRTLWILYGDDQNTFIVRKIGEYGCISADSVVVCQGIVYWLTEEGIFSFDGANAPQYLSERIRTLLEAIPIADWQNANAWFADRTYYISFPHISGTTPITFTGRLSGSNTGTPTVTVSSSGQRQSTAQQAQTASVTISCTGVLHKPTPSPDTWFTTYTCSASHNVTGSWPVTANVAPTNSATKLAFVANSITGDANVTLTLKNPGGTTVATFTDIGPGIEYDYSDPSAVTGTYTWSIAVDTSGLTGGQGDTSTAGNYSATVTPTTTVSLPANTGSTTAGVSTVIQTRPASVAPTTAPAQLSCILTAVTTPSDANGATSYTVQLADPNGNVLQTWTGITSDQTLNYFNVSAIAGVYTWTIWATATSTNVASETYACSCFITLTWTESAMETAYNGGVTFGYHLPTKEWFEYPYAVNAAAAQTTENAPLPTLQRLNSVFVAEPGTLNLDTWAAAEQDLGGPVVGSWTGPLTDSEMPGVEKSYDIVELNAPVQNVIATVTLTIDPGASTPPTKTFTWKVDLSKGPTCIWEVPNDAAAQKSNSGFLAQLSVSAPSTVSAPATIYSVRVYGEQKRKLVPLDNGAVQ